MDTRLAADLGVTPNLAIVVELPLRLFSTSIRYEDLAGHEVAIANGNVHHRDETLFGLGDPMLGLRFALRSGDWTFGANVGLRMPAGETQPNPYTEEAETLPHEHFQFGTGTFDPELSLALAYDFGDFALGAWGWTRTALYANQHGYEAGNRYAGGITASTAFALSDWRFSVLIDANTETPERWDGVAPTDDGNRGRFDLYAGLGAAFQPTDAFFVGLTARVPLYHHVVGGQLELPIVIELNIGGSLQLWGPATPHLETGHDHGSNAPADVADTTTPTPVPGKLTVIDYWATWCAPCKELSVLLDEVARQHDWLAVRRLDVGEDAPDGMALPHVEVYDTGGLLIYRGEGDPPALAKDIEAIAHGKRPPSRLP